MAATLAPETPTDGALAPDEDAGQAEVAFRFVKRCVDEQTTHAATTPDGRGGSGAAPYQTLVAKLREAAASAPPTARGDRADGHTAL